MSSGAIILGFVSAIAVSDIAVAHYLRAVADRAELGATVSSSADAAGVRGPAAIFGARAPLMWFIAALVSFVIPTGIDPIKF